MSQCTNVADRQRTPGPHQVVRASAGTGKTYDLSTQYLSLLRRGARPGGILATTFTRKAAGQILGRVLLRLADAAQSSAAAAKLGSDLCAPGLTAQDCGRMLTDLCRQLHRVSVSTIDSFFHRVATCFRHELGLPANMRIVGNDDPQTRRLRRQAIEAVLGDHRLPQLLQMIRRLQHDQAPRSVTEALESIVSPEAYEVFRQHPQSALWRLSPGPGVRHLDDTELTRALDALRCLRSELPQDKRWVKAWQVDLEAATTCDWDAFMNGGLASKIATEEDGQANYHKKPIPRSVVDAYLPLIAHARSALVERTHRQTQATYRLLQQFDDHFTRLRQQQGLLLYSDVPFKLTAAIGHEHRDIMPELYYRLDTHVTHLLLDEFQDTSSQQWQILQPFAQEICAHSDGSRTFYCVGDLKQAIYGWRGGRAEIFGQIERQLHLAPDAEYHKNVSYRSSQVVLNAVNRVFGSIADNPALSRAQKDAQHWQDRFQSQLAHDRDKPGYVELVTSDQPTTAQDTDPVALAHEIFTAEKIAQLAAAAPDRTIGVLVNTNQAVSTMIDLLARKGLNASGEGGNVLTDDPAVRLVLAALTLADHPGHDIAAFHVFHSPLASIVGLKSIEPVDRDQTSLSIRLTLLSRGYAAVIGDWSGKLASACGRRSAQRLGQLVELALRHDPTITLRVDDFVSWAQSTAVEEPSPAPIRVMTVNKAKGLEFDIVVLPDLHRRLLDESRVLLCVHQELGQVRGVYRNAAAHVREASPDLATAYHQRLCRQVHDDLCKLYVAMTRARSALHMVIRPVQLNRHGQRCADGWSTPSFASILRRALCEVEESAQGDQVLYQHGDAHWSGDTGFKPPRTTVAAPPLPPLRLLARSDARSRTWRQVAPSSLESDGRVHARDLLTIQAPEARLRGTLIHAWFEQIEYVDDLDTQPTDDQLYAIARRVAAGQTEHWITLQLNQFKQMLMRPSVRQALSRPTTPVNRSCESELWREHDFAVYSNGRFLRGKFDRVVVGLQSGTPQRADLIDFKTDRVTPDSLDQAIQRYRPQIQAYQAALAVMLNLPAHAIRSRLLFVETGHCTACGP